jgi:hypothetical protein
MTRLVCSLTLSLALAGFAALRAEGPEYAPDRAVERGLESVTRPVDPAAIATRGAVDSRVLVLGSNGAWQVEKAGSGGWYREQSTILERGTNGELQVTVAGTGVKDRTARRFASDFERVADLLRQAQAFRYVETPSWGRPEDLEKYQEGDCADKSFWLAAKLQEAGFASARVVCGIRNGARVGHAWVEVEVDSDVLYLETTTEDPPVPLRTVRAMLYATHPPRVVFGRNGLRVAP